jgi:hypothetical protein
MHKISEKFDTRNKRHIFFSLTELEPYRLNPTSDVDCDYTLNNSHDEGHRTLLLCCAG